jgi:hypothetical protein
MNYAALRLIFFAVIYSLQCRTVFGNLTRVLRFGGIVRGWFTVVSHGALFQVADARFRIWFLFSTVGAKHLCFDVMQ